VPGKGSPCGFRFGRRDVQAILTPNFAWPPSESPDPDDTPDWAVGIPIWWWNRHERKVSPIRHFPARKNRRYP
jgi:hypothetical protein